MTKSVNDLQYETKNYWTLKTDKTSTSDVMYIGKATPGTSTATPAWQISKLDKTTELELSWADEGRFTQVWDDRLSLTFS
jgi:hypothetical protein